MKVNILGQDYKIDVVDKPDETMVNRNCDGYCDNTIHTIVVQKFEPTAETYKDLDLYLKKVLRHEIIHAFLYQSGLDTSSKWARDEELVDWIALQFPKLMNAMKDAEAI